MSPRQGTAAEHRAKNVQALLSRDAQRACSSCPMDNSRIESEQSKGDPYGVPANKAKLFVVATSTLDAWGPGPGRSRISANSILAAPAVLRAATGP